MKKKIYFQPNIKVRAIEATNVIMESFDSGNAKTPSSSTEHYSKENAFPSGNEGASSSPSNAWED